MDIDDETAVDENYDFRDMLQIHDIADIFELCKDQCNIRYLTLSIRLVIYEMTYRTEKKYISFSRPLGRQISYVRYDEKNTRSNEYKNGSH